MAPRRAAEKLEFFPLGYQGWLAAQGPRLGDMQLVPSRTPSWRCHNQHNLILTPPPRRHRRRGHDMIREGFEDSRGC
ncbi:hypothetical protein ACJ73_05772 [Blastomyces percursus]|uniref:Uncharacterized protein n=1 Tax=Blastomyces percursus TaxID=1658174 RepID=A0A1J9R320_9EURO|nr:hypothetical protein ACJ73_05772 [Blastomyces percursus]